MANRRIATTEISEIIRLLRAGESERTVARIMGYNRRTVVRFGRKAMVQFRRKSVVHFQP
jgi:DNA-binding CsgD family transcriptional regulator